MSVGKPWEIDLTIYDDEPELLAGLRRGERMACTCLLKRHAPRLYRLALHLMGDADEAEDVLQEAFINACAHIAEFEGRSGLGTWLIGRGLLGHQVLSRLQQLSQSLRQPDASGTAGGSRWEQDDDEIDEMARAVDRFLQDRSQLALTRTRLEIEQQRLAAIIDNIADCIVVLHGGRVQEMNRAAEQIFGMKPEQARGRRGEDLLLGLNWLASTLPGVTQDAHARDMTGRTIPVEVTLSPVPSAGDLVVLVIRDATVRQVGKALADDD